MTIDDFLRRIANSWDHAGLNTTYTSSDVGEKPFPIPCSTVQDRFLEGLANGKFVDEENRCGFIPISSGIRHCSTQLVGGKR